VIVACAMTMTPAGAVLRSDRRARLAWAGVVGPVTFVAGWAVAGALTPGYSPLSQPVSRLAAAGAPQRPLMNAGFLAFAVAMPVYAVSLRAELPGRTWLVALANGVATAAIVATPLGYSQAVDTAHAGAAGVAYLALAALPLAAAVPLARTGRPRAARASVVLGLVAGASLAATSADRAVGLFQRAGLTLVDAWIVATALAMLRKRP
jgi:hypothetical membrane protein